MNTFSSPQPSTDLLVESRRHESAQGGSFYHCEDVQACGLRFPVTLGDPFSGRCPRCGATAQLVARVRTEPEANTTLVAGAPVEPDTSTLEPKRQLHLLLDNWRSVFNVGAAFRTADGAGVRHLYLCGITATPDQQRKLAKTALGAEQAVAWSYHPDAVTLATTLQRQGAQLWVLESGPTARSLFDITGMAAGQGAWPGSPVVLAAGNEVVGVDPGLIARADQIIQLPMQGVKQSLNVAVALSIATYWLTAQQVPVHGV